MQIYYLEMVRPPIKRRQVGVDVRADVRADVCADVRVEHCASPDPEQYRRWYREVGDDWSWVDRLTMDTAELALWLQQRDIQVWLLQVEAVPAGFCEIDFRTRDVEIVYFGLFPQFIGRGLGKWFLDWVVEHAWSASPHRVWLHTCEADHPAALPNYERAGFRVYDVRSS